MDKERFSLLLLEPNEVYFEDFAVNLWQLPTKPSEEDVAGRLKMCSKSLVFDPKNTRMPLIKLRYNDCREISELIQTSHGENKQKNCMIVRSTHYIEMLEKNIIAPYNFKKESRDFVFQFQYVDINNYVLQLCQQLHRASSLHTLEQNDMIATIVFSRLNRLKFDPLWMENIYEKVLFDSKVDEIHPLVSNPGRLLLTNTCMYFQPYNNIQPYPVIKIKLGCVNSFIKRRILLRHTGLEIKWNGSNNHIFISFRNANERNEFCSLIEDQKDFNIPKVEPESMTLKWQNGLISNYDYLLYLNSLADRTFEDLTQYPVFPWIITDYSSNELDFSNTSIYRDLSKPIGALNLERLERLKERCEEMGDTKYLYGSHYSTPGFVLFYLVRKYPHLMLCLQNGRFDHPDRMFNKVYDTFQNCLTNMSDFKELIPEFYDTSQEGDFLINIHKINFGTRSDGTAVNNVCLPPWAHNSPKLFVDTLRTALESDYVSTNLHNWIDLIFGYKQRGEEAEKANNIFYHLCYEGSIDLDSVKDPATRHALEVQISEFGQIPKQLFTKPHVRRKLNNDNLNDSSINDKKIEDYGNMFSNLELLMSYVGHKDDVTSLCLDGDVIVSTGKDGILKYFTISTRKQISTCLGRLPLSCCIKIPNSNVYVVGSWENTISLYNVNYGKISDVIPAHDDSVSCMNLIEDLGLLISGSWDCTVKVWKGFTNVGYRTFRLSNAMMAYLSLEERVTALASNRCANKVKIIIGTECGEVYAWEVDVSNMENLINSDEIEHKLLLKHSSEISGMEFDRTASKLATCSSDGLLVITDTKTGMTLFKKNLDHKPTSLTWCGEADYLLSVDDHGFLSIWDLLRGDLKYYSQLSRGPLSCVKYSSENNYIITAGKNDGTHEIMCWSVV